MVTPGFTVPVQTPVKSWKQPPASWMPFVNVEVAELDVTFNTVACRPWTDVEVPDTFVKILPPVTVTPWVEASPIAVAPPKNVDVAFALFTLITSKAPVPRTARSV